MHISAYANAVTDCSVYFLVHYLDSISPLLVVSITKISHFLLTSVAEQIGLNFLLIAISQGHIFV